MSRYLATTVYTGRDYVANAPGYFLIEVSEENYEFFRELGELATETAKRDNGIVSIQRWLKPTAAWVGYDRNLEVVDAETGPMVLELSDELIDSFEHHNVDVQSMHMRPGREKYDQEPHGYVRGVLGDIPVESRGFYPEQLHPEQAPESVEPVEA